jgi:hypothetical protein
LTMKNAVFLNVIAFGCCTNHRFRRSYLLHHQGGKYQPAMETLIVTSNWSPPDDGGDTFLRSIASKKAISRHMEKMAFLIVTDMKTSGVFQSLVTANIFPSSLNFSTLTKETIRFSITSVVTSATRCHIPEDSFFTSRLIYSNFSQFGSLLKLESCC